MVVKANQSRRFITKPSSYIQQRQTATLRFGPDNRQAQLQRRDATPCLHEIAAFAQFHFSRTRRMIRDNTLDRSISKATPKALAVLSISDWRTTFKFSVVWCNLFRRKVQVVRTCFC